MSDPEERLLRLLTLTNDWLKFAETKNGGLIAIAGLAASQLLTYLSGLKHPSQIESWGTGISCVLLVASAVLALISFFPQTDPLPIASRIEGIPEESDNLYYYGHVARLSPATLVGQVIDLSGQGNRAPTRSESDLAAQVVVNSRITRHKLHLFGWAGVTPVWWTASD